MGSLCHPMGFLWGSSDILQVSLYGVPIWDLGVTLWVSVPIWGPNMGVPTGSQRHPIGGPI